MRNIGRGAVLGAPLALVADLAVFAAGRLTTPVRVVSGWAPEGAEVSAVEVAVTALVAVVAGGAVRWGLSRWRAGAVRIWVPLVAAVAVLSAVPLWRLDIDAGRRPRCP